MQTAAAIFAAYCLGSISFAIVVSWLLRLPDPRSYGSKNPGATNVLRTGSKAAAVLTLAGDAGKGGSRYGSHPSLPTELALAGLAAFLGHLFPVFHRFQGGKGVATAAGVLLALDWRIGARHRGHVARDRGVPALLVARLAGRRVVCALRHRAPARLAERASSWA